jgi:hypothetical protein
VTAVLACAAVAAAAVRLQGALTQLPGAKGCLSDNHATGCSPVLEVGSVLTSSADGRFVYAGPGDVYTFRRDRATGALAAVLPAAGCLGAIPPYRHPPGCVRIRGGWAKGDTAKPEGLIVGLPALTRDGRAAYIPTSVLRSRPGASPPTSEQVVYLLGFRRDPGTGALDQFPEAADCVRSSKTKDCARNMLPGQAVASPDGRNVYLVTRAGLWAFRRDPRTGALTQLPDEIGCVRRAGELPNTGCAAGRGLDRASSLVASADGRNLYGLGRDAISVFRRDPATGGISQLPGKAGCIASRALPDGPCTIGRGLYQPWQLVLSNDGRNAYAVASSLVRTANARSHALSAFRRDPATGALVQLPGAAGCLNNRGVGGCGRATGLFGVSALAIAPDGRSVYAASHFDFALTAFRRDRRTGALSQLPGTAGCAQGRDSYVRLEGCGAGRFDIPVGLLASPDSRSVYLVAATPGSRTAYQIVVFRRTR